MRSEECPLDSLGIYDLTRAGNSRLAKTCLGMECPGIFDLSVGDVLSVFC